MITIQLDGAIRIKNISAKMLADITGGLELPNPAYEKAVRANPNARFALSPFIPYYKKGKDGSLTIDRGNWQKLQRYTSLHGGSTEFALEIAWTTQDLSTPFESNVELRDYQYGVLDELLDSGSHQGVADLYTSFGKTIVAIELIAELQQKTLIIVPKLDLLEQFQKEILKFSNAKSVGTIQGKTIDIQDITVATVQTLINNKNKIDFGQFGLLIVDECHAFITNKRRELIQSIPAYWRYGLTGTNERSDGQGEAIQFVFGETLVKKTQDNQRPTVHIASFDKELPVQEYADMIEEQVNDRHRLQFVADIIERERSEGRKILVLTKRVAHYEALADKIAQKGVLKFSSKGKREERAELLEGLKKGTQDFEVLFGTFSLLSTGIDIPQLDTLIIAGDLKSRVLTTQSAGRILRLHDKKKPCKIIDVVDTKNGILRRQGLERRALYIEKNWPITNYS